MVSKSILDNISEAAKTRCEHLTEIPKKYVGTSKRYLIKSIGQLNNLKYIYNYLKSKRVSMDYDLLIFNTISDKNTASMVLKLTEYIFKPKIAIIIANLDLFFPGLTNRGKEKKADKVFEELMKKVEYIIVGTEFERSLIHGEKPELDNKAIVIPLAYTNEALIKKAQRFFQNYKDTRIRFTIPGGVSLFRRDYYSVFEVMENVISTKVDVELYLLGRIVHEEIIRTLKERYPKTYEISKVFREYIPNEEYYDLLSNSHFVICPIPKDSRYGVSKMSASTEDALITGVPMILPSAYASLIKEETENAAITYDFQNGSLDDAIKRALNAIGDGNYERLKLQAMEHQRSRHLDSLSIGIRKELNRIFFKQ